MEERWGDAATVGLFAPGYRNDERMREMWGNFERAGASPGMARSVMEALIDIDVRPDLARIRVPTTIIHRRGDRAVLFGNAAYIAEHIPGAKLVELPGADHFPYLRDTDDLWDEVAECITGSRVSGEPERVLATILFTDIVGSTDRAHDMGDRRWRDLLEQYYASVRKELVRFGGQEMDTAGDGFFVRFDTPARAIACAKAVNQSVGSLGIKARTGIHTGECEVMGEKLSGMAVHIGARVMALAEPDEILVSSTVKELVTGSKLEFADRGAHALKGVPGEWRLYAVGAVHWDAGL
jgi:class 3 adenylate cyclase